MTIQPECSPFELRNSTLATTPSPSRIRIRVPMNSPKYACTSFSFLERSPRRNVAWCLEVLLHILVELEQCHGEASHLQRGHVLPNVRHTPDIYALALQGIGDVSVGYVELHEGRAAEAVDHHGDVSLREA